MISEEKRELEEKVRGREEEVRPFVCVWCVSMGSTVVVQLAQVRLELDKALEENETQVTNLKKELEEVKGHVCVCLDFD